MQSQGYILSAGGSRGAYQAGAIYELTQGGVINPRWVSGVSIGAFNGLALACGKTHQLEHIWGSLSSSDIYELRSPVLNFFRFVLSKFKLASLPPSIFRLDPLWSFMRELTEGWETRRYLLIGLLNFETSLYETVTIEPGTKVDDTVLAYVIASGAIPILFPPIEIQNTRFGDGAVRIRTPFTNLIDHDPDLINIISCDPFEFDEQDYNGDYEPPKDDILSIAQSTLDILGSQSFRADLKTFFERNQVAKTFGPYKLNGKTIKHYDYVFVRPKRNLGGSINFKPIKNLRLFELGRLDAKDAKPD